MGGAGSKPVALSATEKTLHAPDTSSSSDGDGSFRLQTGNMAMNLSGQEAASIAHKMLEANHERLKLEEKRIAEEHERIQVENKRADTERVRNYLIAAVALAALAVVHKRTDRIVASNLFKGQHFVNNIDGAGAQRAALLLLGVASGQSSFAAQPSPCTVQSRSRAVAAGSDASTLA